MVWARMAPGQVAMNCVPVVPADDLPGVDEFDLRPEGRPRPGEGLLIVGFDGAGVDPGPTVARLVEWADAYEVEVYGMAVVREGVVYCLCAPDCGHVEPVSHEAAAEMIAAGEGMSPVNDEELRALMRDGARREEVASALEEVEEAMQPREAAEAVLRVISGPDPVEDLPARVLALAGWVLAGRGPFGVTMRDVLLDQIAPFDHREVLHEVFGKDLPNEVWQEMTEPFAGTHWASGHGADSREYVTGARRLMQAIGAMPHGYVGGVAALSGLMAGRGGAGGDARVVLEWAMGAEPEHSLCWTLLRCVRAGVRL